MSTEFSKGDKVQWESSQGTIEGTVEKKLTEPTDIKKYHVNIRRSVQKEMSRIHGGGFR